MSARALPLLVVGAGPAGLSASVQARRDCLEHVVISTEPPGGLVCAAWRIDNLAGFPGGVTGEALGRRLARHARDLELPLVTDRVSSLSHREGLFTATLGSGDRLAAHGVILATGTRPRPWDVDGASGVQAAGLLHRDVRGLPGDLQGRDVLIVGGGDAALDSALSVCRRGGRATVLVRGRESRANERILARLEGREIRLLTETAVEAVEMTGDRVRVLPARLQAHHLLVCIGRVPRDELYRQLLEARELPEDVTTGLDGLYVAGDLVAGADRFIARAMGQGQRAAIHASGRFCSLV